MSKNTPTIEEVDQARRAIGKALDIFDGLPKTVIDATEGLQAGRKALDLAADDLKLLRGSEELTVAEHAERLYPST